MLGRTKAALGLAGSSASGSSSSSSNESRLGVPAASASKTSTSTTATRRSLSRTNSASHRSTSSPQRAANHIGSVVDDWPMYSSQPEDYILGDIIGHGASSTVYQAAFQPLNGRACAVKVIDLEAFGRDTDELRRETQLMSLSKHPNVLRVRGCWVKETKLHIATRLMSSGSMLDIMRFAHTDGFHEDVICTVLKQALQGLDYLHVNGWLHRDLKAANLLVDEDGTVLLGDFGVGVWVGEGRSIGRSGSVGGKRKSFVGTPCWMAPEVISRQDYNSKADIWSFGITALELSQGHAPHSRLPPVKVLMKTLDEESPRLDMVGGAHRYSKTFADFVDLCLQKEPDKRPSAAALLKHPFFKHAKPPKYLINAILADLPPLSERQESFKKRTMSIQTARYLQSWDFSVESPANSPTIGRMLNLGTPCGTGSSDPFSGFEGSVSSPGPASARSSRIAPRRVRLQSSSGSIGETSESAAPTLASGGGTGKKILSIDGEHAIVVEDEDGLEDGHEAFADSETAQQADETLASSASALALDTAVPASTTADDAGPSTRHIQAIQGALTSSPVEESGASTSNPEEQQTEGSQGQRLRIAIVSDFFYPNLGGVEGHISEISALLVAPPFNHHVVIITHAYAPSRIGVRHLSTGVTVYYLPLRVIASQDTLPNFYTSHPLLRYIFIRERIQLVHAHQALSSLAHEALFHAREAGIKTVFTDHSLFSLDEDAASILTNKLLRFVLSDVDRVVCVSHAARENTVLRGGIREPGRRVVVIPNAVDGEKFRPLTPEERSTRPSGLHRHTHEDDVSSASSSPLLSVSTTSHRTTIVILSRLMYRKGIDLLIEAIPRICLAHPEVDFLIGGDGPKRVELEQMRERCLLLDRVQLVGSVKQGSVRDHLTRGEIFLSPSLTEAFGTSLIEAASCGLLIVATEVGGVPEILPSPEMLLLAAPNTDELVRVVSLAVHRVRTQLESGQWDPWRIHARTRGMYSWAEVVRRLEGVYYEAMRERSVGRMERLMRYWENAGPESPLQTSATTDRGSNGDGDDEAALLSGWQIKKSWVAGSVFCIVIMVDMVFAWLLEWGWPRADIDVVVGAAKGAFDTVNEEDEGEDDESWSGGDVYERNSAGGYNQPTG